MANVNPSPIRPPRKWLDDPEISKDVQDLYFFVFQLLQRTGGGTDLIEVGNEQIVINTAGIAQNVIDILTNAANISINAGAIDQLDRYFPNLLPQLAAINEQIGSGDFLTSDETGFTVDMTTLSTDMTES